VNDDALAGRRRTNAVMFSLTAACAVLALSVLFFILGYIAWHGFSALSWDFLTKLPKPVGETGGGIANSVLGTFKLVALAAALGVPVGVLGAVYLAEHGKGRLGWLIRYSADLLNGTPSIVMGVFAFALVVAPMKRFSALAGAVALALILVPIVLRGAEEFIRLVPDAVREGAMALGLARWKVTMFIVLPTAKKGILTVVLLAMSRVAGETAPLLFTAFGNRFWDDGFLHPMASLPHTIFTYAIAPYADWHRQAWAGALLLLLVVLAGNAAARLVQRSGGA